MSPFFRSRRLVTHTPQATCSGDNTVAITDIKTQETTARLVGHKSGVKNVVWNANQPSERGSLSSRASTNVGSDILASSGRDGCICIWDLRKPAADQDGDGAFSSSHRVLILTYYFQSPNMAPLSQSRARMTLQANANGICLCVFWVLMGAV